MQNKSGVISIGIVGVIVIAFSLTAFFMLDIERISVNRWALAFLLFSECVLFGGLMGLRLSDVNHGKVFLKTGVTTALSLQFFVTLVSMILANGFREKPNTFILIEITIIALFAIITISIFAYSCGIERRNEEDMKKIGTNKPKRGEF